MKIFSPAFILSSLSLLSTLSAKAAIGDWKIYMAYSDIQQIVEAGSGNLFVRASNSIYLYNTDDQSITTFDKTTGLTDVTIDYIAWNSNAGKVVIVYDNTNIDLMDTDGDVTNVSDLYNKNITEDKTINSITIYGKYAYLATNFGAVKLNVADAEISESYFLDITAKKVGISGGNIYILQKNGSVLMASLSASNLQDKSFWTTTKSYPDGIFDEDLSAYEENIDIVKTLSPGGPKYNYTGFLKINNGILYSCNGVWDEIQCAALQSFDGNNWTFYGDSAQISSQTDHRYENFICLDIDPKDDDHILVGAMAGLYEFKNGAFYKHHNYSNSLIKRFEDQNKRYQLITALTFDDNGNAWCVNSQVSNQCILKLSSDGEWTSYPHDEVLDDDGISFYDMRNAMIDSRGLLWFGNNYYVNPYLICYNPDTDEIKVYEDYVNQDGTTLSITGIRDVAEDKENNIWVGMTYSLTYLPESEIESDDDVFYQYKVARNDGTNLADYLLDGVAVNAIAIDGANRKWFGTIGNGLYLISSDNNEQIYHFTQDNSMLLSNNILDLAYDSESGKIYIGTELGLCSFETDATEPSEDMTTSNVYAYPNPVRPDYTGLITVVGLSDDADVKVTTATGYLVYEGRSNGGTFTWDGCDKKGNRVASGVYNVLTAKSDGEKGTVCKIAIVR